MTVPYASVARLRATLERSGGGLPEDDKALPTSWPDEVLLRHLVDANGVIDSRLGSVTRVPFGDPAPELVVGLCADIAAYRAWLSFRGSSDLEERDPFALRYREAIELMRDIVRGDAIIPPSTGPEAPAGQSNVINQYPGNMFGMDDFAIRREGNGYGVWG